MSQFIWSIIGITALIHGYCYVRYTTPDPCAAAFAEFTVDKVGATVIPQEWVAKIFKGDRNPQIFLACYKIALFGPQAAAPVPPVPTENELRPPLV